MSMMPYKPMPLTIGRAAVRPSRPGPPKRRATALDLVDNPYWTIHRGYRSALVARRRAANSLSTYQTNSGVSSTMTRKVRSSRSAGSQSPCTSSAGPRLFVDPGQHAEGLPLGNRHIHLLLHRYLDRTLQHTVHTAGGVTLAADEIARAVTEHHPAIARDLPKVGLFVHVATSGSKGSRRMSPFQATAVTEPARTTLTPI
jgi:hypothetical protein